MPLKGSVAACQSERVLEVEMVENHRGVNQGRMLTWEWALPSPGKVEPRWADETLGQAAAPQQLSPLVPQSIFTKSGPFVLI